MKGRKLNYTNILKFILFMVCMSVIIDDTIKLVIEPFITSYLTTFTWLGVVTFGMSITIVTVIYDDFKDQIKSIPESDQTLEKDTNK